MLDVECDLFATLTAPKVLITVRGIEGAGRRVRAWTVEDEGGRSLVGETVTSTGGAVFVDYFPDLSNRVEYLIECEGHDPYRYGKEREVFWAKPGSVGWLRDAHRPGSDYAISFKAGDTDRDYSNSNFLTYNTARELAYEGGGETVQILGARLPVVISGALAPVKQTVEILLQGEAEIKKARRLLSQARLLCLQTPPMTGWRGSSRTLFTPVEAEIRYRRNDVATLGLKVTPVARPRNIYQPERLISVFNTKTITWGQARANASRYTLAALHAFPNILLGENVTPLMLSESEMAAWWLENASE